MTFQGWWATARAGEAASFVGKGVSDEPRDVTPGSRVSGEGARLSGSPPRIDPHAQAVVAAVLRDRWDRVSPPTAGRLQQDRQVEALKVADEVLERLGRCGWRLVRSGQETTG